MARPPDRRDGLDPDAVQALDAGVGRADDDALLARVKRRVLEAIAREPQPGLRTVRAHQEDGWHEVAPGVRRKVLWRSGNEQSCMVRLAPGAVFGGHWHAADEECVVLEGSVRIGTDLVLHAGDFHVGSKGTRHPSTRSDEGALVYLRGAVDTAAD